MRTQLKRCADGVWHSRALDRPPRCAAVGIIEKAHDPGAVRCVNQLGATTLAVVVRIRVGQGTFHGICNVEMAHSFFVHFNSGTL